MMMLIIPRVRHLIGWKGFDGRLFILKQAVNEGVPMDSKAMADNFLEALQNGTTQPAAQDASAAGFAPALMHRVLIIAAILPAEHDTMVS